MDIQHTETESKGRFFIEVNGLPKAEMTYSKARPNVMIIDHTEVSESLEGQGVGRKLVIRGVEKARAEGLKIMPLCPFAAAMFQRHPEWSDLRL